MKFKVLTEDNKMNITERKCEVCCKVLDIQRFVYENKEHDVCIQCFEKKRTGKTNICEICGKRANFNLKGVKPGIRCGKHKLPGMIDVSHSMCRKCGIVRPSYNIIGSKTPEFCKNCKDDDMVYIGGTKCAKCGKRNPSYGYKDKRERYCGDCKKDDMENVVSPKCKCGKHQPSFGFENSVRAEYCGECKLPGMIDIKHSLCVCGNHQPSFNFEGKKPEYCGDCKLPGMINVKSLMCIRCGSKQPSFGYEEDDRPKYCGDCKLPGMVNVVSEMCVNCGKHQPVYAVPESIIATHCFSCKSPNMVDIKNLRCTSCSKQACYGIPLNKPTKCGDHKEDNMIKNPRHTCEFKNCKEIAVFGIKTPMFCDIHKRDNDISLIERECISCGRIDIVDEIQVCINFCNKSQEFEKYKKRYKIKEENVYQLLRTEFGEPTIRDKVVDSDCGKQRPDIVYELDTHVVVQETDERQHSSSGYCESGEYARMINIYNSYGGLPVVFVRYNPDDFKINGKVRKINREKKENTLVLWMRDAIQEIPKYNCQIVYLFYDDYDESISEFTEIDPYNNKEFSCSNCGYKTYITGFMKSHNC